MSKQAMNYIIEKMRGDSLTPLGTSKGDRDGSHLLKLLVLNEDNELNNDDIEKFLKGLEKHLSRKGNTFLFGKWSLVSMRRVLRYDLHDLVTFTIYVASLADVFVTFKINNIDRVRRSVLCTYHISGKTQQAEAENVCVEYIKDKFGSDIRVDH